MPDGPNPGQSYEAWIESKAGACPPDPFNPDGELCAACGKPAKGYAFVDDKRYCHGDEPGETCYENAEAVDIAELFLPLQLEAMILTENESDWPQPSPPPFPADDEGLADPCEACDATGHCPHGCEADDEDDEAPDA